MNIQIRNIVHFPLRVWIVYFILSWSLVRLKRRKNLIWQQTLMNNNFYKITNYRSQISLPNSFKLIIWQGCTKYVRRKALIWSEYWSLQTLTVWRPAVQWSFTTWLAAKNVAPVTNFCLYGAIQRDPITRNGAETNLLLRSKECRYMQLENKNIYVTKHIYVELIHLWNLININLVLRDDKCASEARSLW